VATSEGAAPAAGVVPGLGEAGEVSAAPGVSPDLAMAGADDSRPLAPPPAPQEQMASVTPVPPRNPDAPKPVQAVSLITVGVRDMPSSIRFYEALGWRRAAPNKYDQTAFFQLQGQILALYPMNEQLREQNMPEAAPAPGGITLALHVQDKADVWSIYQRFIDAGGKSLRAPAEMASGAVTSYVADPDGNPWEISFVPQFRIDEEGGLWLP
jgi:predicted lactoylglutathione lyase